MQVDSGGITLRANEVAIDADGGSAGLTVSLGNRGRVEARGRVEVELPAGITVPAPPARCVAATATRTRCDLGSVPAGRTAQLRLPIAAAPQVRRAEPLAGVVIGHLDQRDGPSRRVQLSFQITAVLPEGPAVVPPPVAAPSALPAGATARGDGMTSTTRTAVSLIALPVLLALGLVTMSLRRRTAVPGADPPAAQRAASGPPPGTGSAPETEGGIWFRAQRPARRRGGDLDYGAPDESPQDPT
ncbi:hypothetical protein QQG74_03605 [Micromonospora sp. FIMYZ51]|uniref:hypothetical protein n=1 Tax=Micromonospora sp. FIMYZ51 TaxID=3051832 RepID=UPI00311F0AF1